MMLFKSWLEIPPATAPPRVFFFLFFFFDISLVIPFFGDMCCWDKMVGRIYSYGFKHWGLL
ncbi:hypothetical protein CROQUDRAFT_244350 [Cronartium quercuum f. sp. fusiforme G11]|uniref:Uncharacterized protein n=1 Tax=Cronartium quercuum f. sp. fusiforme G11 TaxID=708437 RepID=A0A9P6N925_9BASI|nr:hypothetical protein CROQUDRAFT_244350 [Cronartium quercuum f. sp. fusiforme G11]